MQTHVQRGLDTSGCAYVVTGAGSGINHTIARALAAAGCTVAAWDLKRGLLEQSPDSNIFFTKVDVTDRTGLRNAARDTAQRCGGIAGVVAGAGIMINKPFLDIEEISFDLTMAINLKGAMLTAQATAPFMQKAGGGSIVMFASMLARSGGPNAADYIASKGGILGLARSLAAELGKDNIRVNTISPTLVDTPMPQAVYSRERFRMRGEAAPMGRLPSVEEIASVALFLLSEEASFITGQDIRLSGGERLI